MRLRRIVTGVAAAVAMIAAVLSSQGRGNPTEWPTAYGDAQHTSWIRSDGNISVATMSQPGFGLQWETKLESPATARRFADPGRCYLRRDAVHADFDHRRSIQPRLCCRQRHGQRVLDAPLRGIPSRRFGGMPRRDHRRADENGESRSAAWCACARRRPRRSRLRRCGR